MQEHEFIYEHGQRTARSSEQDCARIDEPGGIKPIYEIHENEELNDGVIIEDLDLLDEVEGIRDHRATLRLGRGLVLGLGLSFVACLAALWLTGTLISAPMQVVPLTFLQMLAANRIPVLLVPVVCLGVCYIGLRSLTAEIVAVPEYRLDERQKALRDQAHRSAFKLIQFACFLIPCGFLLFHLPWFSPAAPAPAVPPTWVASLYSSDGNPIVLSPHGGYIAQHVHIQYVRLDSASVMRLTPASTLEIVVAAGVLLVGLLLMVSALPMAVLAWKGRA